MKPISIFSFIFLISFICNAQIITTYAGNGTVGYHFGDGGPATNAELAAPAGISFDNSGNLLICQHLLVKKVNAVSGIISIIAGDTATTITGDGGPATGAYISPVWACVDPTGNLYISDYAHPEVRKVDITTGIITAYAGTGIIGFSGDNGPATAAELGAGITGVCIDTTRKYLYIADEWNFRIRRVDMVTGIITTIAGIGTAGFSGDGIPATSSEINHPLGICLDNSGNLYIGDWQSGRIRKVDVVTGMISTVAGNGTTGYSGDNGSATNAMISIPYGLCIDRCGNLYFSDVISGGSQRVRKVDSLTGIITTVAGDNITGYTGDSGPATNAELHTPYGVCIDSSGNLFIADENNERIRKVTFETLCDGTTKLNNTTGAENNISIYPNPAKNIIYVDGIISLLSYKLFNLVGVVVQQGTLHKGSNNIPVQQLPPGVYMIVVQDPATGFKTTRKIVKQ